MEDYISLSTLNDFIFCPYSIYLHSVYMSADEDVFKAKPQVEGTIAHSATDSGKSSTKKDDLFSLPVYSDELGVMGVIDVYRREQKLLIERKNNLKKIFRGQLYQLWAQYFCLVEMGYQVEQIAFYEITTNKMLYQQLPGAAEKTELMAFVDKFKHYSPENDIFQINHNKCVHCIYCNLCEKTFEDNVYT